MIDLFFNFVHHLFVLLRLVFHKRSKLIRTHELHVMLVKFWIFRQLVPERCLSFNRRFYRFLLLNKYTLLFFLFHFVKFGSFLWFNLNCKLLKVIPNFHKFLLELIYWKLLKTLKLIFTIISRSLNTHRPLLCLCNLLWNLNSFQIKMCNFCRWTC